MMQRAELLAAHYRLRELQRRGEARALLQMALQAAPSGATAPERSRSRDLARRIRAAFPTSPAAVQPHAGTGSCAVSAPAGCCASPA